MRRLATLLLLIFFVGCGNDGEGNGYPGKDLDATPTVVRTATARPLSTPTAAGFPSSPGAAATRTATAASTQTATRAPSVFLLGRPVAGNPGQVVLLEVRLKSTHDPVAGTQNDLEFGGSPLRIAANANGKPDCTVNPAINKAGTSFSFRPSGCATQDCTSVRALVIALDNSDPIPDGSVLYTCAVHIDDAAAQGTFFLTLSGVIASTPAGSRISDAVGESVLVVVRNGAIPTPAPNGLPCQFVTDCQSSGCVDGFCCATTTCPYSQTCGLPSSPGTCTPRQSSGEGCSRNADCVSGFCRADGVCDEPPQHDGGYCNNDSSCASGHCVDSVCCVEECAAGQVCNAPGFEGRCVTPALKTQTPTATTSRTPTRKPPETPSSRALLYAMPIVGNPGQSVPLEIRLNATTVQVAGTQNDLQFGGSPLRIAPKSNGRPDCTVNPAINKNGTSFSFRPAGCSGDTCSSVRALVLALDNTDAIPNDDLLYTCTVDIAEDAADGQFPIVIDGVRAATPDGAAIAGVGGGSAIVIVRHGSIPTPAPNGVPCQFVTDCRSTNCVDGVCCSTASCPSNESCSEPANPGVCTFKPSGDRCSSDADCASGSCGPDRICLPPPRKTPTATPTPAPAARLDAMVLGFDSVANTAEIGVRLSTATEVAGVQNDLLLTAADARFLATAEGKPDCTVLAAINKAATNFSFQREGCHENGCTMVRAIVVSFDNVAPIADGALLYTCRVEVVGGSSDLEISGAIASSPQGQRITAIGYGIVVGGPTPTATIP
ncbi:MAG: hypothetical protein HY270_12350 [Deltaproteobacteria bacterium]|nr:hypothetical protein [Deltaproteobacteria bacterium]